MTCTWQIEFNADPFARDSVDAALVFHSTAVDKSISKHLHSLININVLKQNHDATPNTTIKVHC